MRHYRLLRQQVHELELSQRAIKNDISEMQNQKLGERVRILEVDEKKLADSSFNLSRQISNLDKLHSSLLELLEDINDIQTRFDKTIPEIRREITKVEIDSAQMSSDQSILREEESNMSKTVQALAVSINALQNERSKRHNLDSEVNKLDMEVEKLKFDAASHAKQVRDFIVFAFIAYCAILSFEVHQAEVCKVKRDKMHPKAEISI